MSSLRLTFPEKDTPTIVALRGPRVTVGRLPSNAIQIRDRTVSARHAEFIFEDDHYRLHDLGATNGVLVNGEPVTDFHLRETCEISFGGVVGQFSLETPETPDVTTEALATHAECAALTRENAELKQQNAAAQEEIENLRRVHAATEGDTGLAAEQDRLVEECATLKRAADEQARAFAQLREEHAVLRRDRDNLQRALQEARSPVAKPAPPLVTEPMVPTDDATTAEAPAAAFTPPPPAAKPFVIPPTGRPAPASAPGPAAAPRLPQPAFRPVVSAKQPPNSNPVARPLPAAKPSVTAVPTARPNVPVVRAVKPIATPSTPSGTPVGPKGTQKVSV